ARGAAFLAGDVRETRGGAETGDRHVADAVDRNDLAAVELDDGVVEPLVGRHDAPHRTGSEVVFGLHRHAGRTAVRGGETHQATGGVVADRGECAVEDVLPVVSESDARTAAEGDR